MSKKLFILISSFTVGLITFLCSSKISLASGYFNFNVNPKGQSYSSYYINQNYGQSNNSLSIQLFGNQNDNSSSNGFRINRNFNSLNKSGSATLTPSGISLKFNIHL